MTYGEANSVLESSLSPTNRCITKSVALANGAETDPLSSYATNRLVPASAVQKGSTPPGPEPPGPGPEPPTHTFEHYFVLSNGTYSASPTVYVGLNDTETYFDTVILVDGEVYKDSEPYSSDWKFDTPEQDIGDLILKPQIHDATVHDSNTGIFTQNIQFKSESVGVEGAHGKIGVRLLNGSVYMSDKTIYITFVRSSQPAPPTQ